MRNCCNYRASNVITLMLKLLGPFKELLTLSNMPLKGAIKDEQLTIMQNGGIVIQDDRIYDVGSYNTLLNRYQSSQTEIIRYEAEGVALPGFVDSHTHLCFSGSRSRDFALRNSGLSYIDIARMGGGIWQTVIQTRAAADDTLRSLMRKRIDKHLSSGVTTIEIKSGYGLSVEQELRMLRIIKEISDTSNARIISTCLAAHTLPKDFSGHAKEYLDRIARDLFPVISEEKLSHRIDAFIEQEAFLPSDILPYLKTARNSGFDITIHADQFTSSGSEIAVDIGAVSADHLEASTAADITRLAHSNTVATALPGASIGLGCDFAPARRLLDAGACLAIASDWNPGSAPLGDLLTLASILGTFEKLSTAEVFAALTYRAAFALRKHNIGQLSKGFYADIVIYPTHDFREILYHQGQLKPCNVWAKGQLVYQSSVKL